MNYLYITLFLFAGILLIGCEKKDIGLFGNEHYVYFTTEEEGFHASNATTDSTIVSFFFYMKDDIQYPIEVGLTGQSLDQNTKFKIVADKAKSDLPERLYDIPEFFEFTVGKVTDTIYIRLKNDPMLLERQYTLKLDIVDYGELRTHKGVNGRRILKVCDIAAKPSWWVTNPIEWYYLGEYSRKKYELFMQVTGVSDLGSLGEGKIRLLTLEFQHWLDSQNPKILEDDGNEMTTEVIG